MTDTPDDIVRDVAAVQRISAVPSLLQVICRTTSMGFAAVTRVTEGSWTLCAVQDGIGFGIAPGGQLPVETTLCREVRLSGGPLVIDHASVDPRYRDHCASRIYHLESYVSVPIVTEHGGYFGNLCAFDPKPRRVSDPSTVAMFTAFADLVALQLDTEARHAATASALIDERATAELREQFIAVLGHDLRSPLSAVVTIAGLLSRGPQGVDLAQLGVQLRSSADRMSRLIDDVLDLARSRLGDGIFLAREGDLASAVHDVIDELRVANPVREIAEHCTIPEGIACDRQRIQQLLSNLVSNAATYGSPAEPIGVDARLEDGVAVLGVSNRGEPIPPESLGRLFEPYWRPTTSRPGSGLGLGLYICSRIVHAHGGTLTVRSSADEGTRFEARIPVSSP